MNKIINLLKINMKQNKKLFLTVTLINLVVMIIAVAAMIAILRVNKTPQKLMSIFSGGYMKEFFIIYHLGSYSVTAFIILFMVYSIYVRFSNDDGILYNFLQLPLGKAWHGISLYVEFLIFILLQYAIVIAAGFLISKYAYDITRPVLLSDMYGKILDFNTIFDAVTGGTVFYLGGVENFIRRIFIYWFMIASFIVFVMTAMKKYGFIILIPVFLALALFFGIAVEGFPMDYMDIAIIAVLNLVSYYLFSRKMDF